VKGGRGKTGCLRLQCADNEIRKKLGEGNSGQIKNSMKEKKARNGKDAQAGQTNTDSTRMSSKQGEMGV